VSIKVDPSLDIAQIFFVNLFKISAPTVVKNLVISAIQQSPRGDKCCYLEQMMKLLLSDPIKNLPIKKVLLAKFDQIYPAT
jgi:hypothetical protein